MKKTIIIKGPQQKALVATILGNLPEKPLHEVVIREHKKNRSLNQNSLMWKWLTIISAELGMTKEALHLEYKYRFLAPIFIRDDEQYAAMATAVKAVRAKGLDSEALVLRDQIINLTSTTQCNTAQMSEYMTDIERAATDLGVGLPHPEDI